MAPIGTVIKNGLLFVILLLPIAWVSGLLISAAIVDLNYAANDDNGNPINRNDIDRDSGSHYMVAVQGIALTVMLIVGVGGLIFMKSLSDTVEDGMVEF